MAVVKELVRGDQDALSFGNYELAVKTKKDGFEWKGDIYKVRKRRRLSSVWKRIVNTMYF